MFDDLRRKQQLGFFLERSDSGWDGESDLNIIDQELVLCDLEETDDYYETTTIERINETLAEIESSIEILSDLKPANENHPWTAFFEHKVTLIY